MQKILFLFFTQAEGGAPGYLSRKGEESAFHFTKSLRGFFIDSLGLPIEEEFEARVKSLSSNPKWKELKQSSKRSEAIKESISLFPILVTCGGNPRTLRTAELVSQEFALPVSIDERLDDEKSLEKGENPLQKTISFLMEEMTKAKRFPKLILLGVSLPVLATFLKHEMKDNDYSIAMKHLQEGSYDNTAPAGLIGGLEFEEETKSFKWVFDLED